MEKREWLSVGGRFQPFHLGHLHFVKEALKISERLVIGIVNADIKEGDKVVKEKNLNLPFSSDKNPFTYWERYRMIKESLEEDGVDSKRIYIVPYYPRYPFWEEKTEQFFPLSKMPKFLIVVSEWDREKLADKTNVIFSEDVLQNPKTGKPYTATEIRDKMISGDNSWKDLVPKAVAKIIEEIGAEEIKKRLL